MAVVITPTPIVEPTYTGEGYGVDSHWIEYGLEPPSSLPGPAVTQWDAAHSHTVTGTPPYGVFGNEWGDRDVAGHTPKPWINGVLEVVGYRSMFRYHALDRLQLSPSMIAEAWANVVVVSPSITTIRSRYYFDSSASGNVENIYFGPNDWWCASQETDVQTTGVPLSIALQKAIPTSDTTWEPQAISTVGSIASVSHGVPAKIDVTDMIKAYCANMNYCFGFQLMAHCEGGVDIEDITDWTKVLKGLAHSPYWDCQIEYTNRSNVDYSTFATGTIESKNLEYSSISVGTVWVKLANLKELVLRDRVFYCDPVYKTGPPRLQA